MVDLWIEFVKSLIILFPAFAANAFPPLAKGKRPIDFGKSLFGNRIFGNGKTIEGFALGTLAGFLVGALETVLYPYLNAYAMEFGVTLPLMTFQIGLLIAVATLLGDLAGSFLKRRFGLERGADVLFLDQWNFILMTYVFAVWFIEINLWMLGLMLITTLIVHRIANIIAHRLKIKKEPW
ncbi:MAG: CDP-2,3-bis-(O-geranylgeranyl)-sn-glycerol synthase [Candidatus Aenigmarchaeota archaeon]|nr:CDP-2,3-bis-(O-geranylgeranyl)-sn-glycerol synthase [Candidatus Aenigmarchaeota archaeon]